MADPSEERQLIAGELSPEKRAEFKAWVGRPEYRKLIGDVMKACVIWKELFPEKVPVWVENGRVLVLGDPRSDSSLGMIAGNDDAKHCLRYADAQTNQQASVMTLQLALIGLGWVK